MAAELVRRPVTLLAATGGEPAALAARAATSTIPIVFAIGGDPVKLGLAASFNRPSHNATGISLLTNILEPKRIGLLHDLVPNARTIGALVNPSFPPAEVQSRDAQEAARALGIGIHIFRADADRDIDEAFATIARERVGALAVFASPFFDTRRDKLVGLAARHAVPTMYHFREFVAAGGLMSYGINFPDAYRQVGVYSGRILKGEKAADLPVVQPRRFEFVLNLKTAKTLGLTVSPPMLLLVDETIE
jgi:putative ABC transport system substrate-binding protein